MIPHAISAVDGPAELVMISTATVNKRTSTENVEPVGR